MFKNKYFKIVFCSVLLFSILLVNTGIAIVTPTVTSLTTNQWTRVEKGLDDPSNFAYGGVVPKFDMDEEGVIEFDSGHALHGSDYEGYYWKAVDLKEDFELTYKTMIYTGYTDSNFIFVSLTDNKSNEVYNIYKNDQVSIDSVKNANIFYSYISPGRSWWTSLYGSGQGGPGFPLIGATVRGDNISREDYSAYDKYLGDNKYGYKHNANETYAIKISRKAGVFLFSITDSDNELVHEWKLEDKNDVHFRYLSIGNGNTDDLDSPIGSQKGKIWDIELSTELSNETPEPPIVNGSLVYESLLPLLGVQKLAYRNFNNKTYYINNKEELKKYSDLVELEEGNIIVGKIYNNSRISHDPYQKFIKKPDSKAVYYVDEEKKQLKQILNPAGLKKIADIPANVEIDWSIVKEITTAEFDKYSTYVLEKVSGEVGLNYKNGDLVKSIKDNKVYLIEEGKKKHIVDEAVFKKLKLNWGDIKTLSELIMQSLKVGEEISVSDVDND